MSDYEYRRRFELQAVNMARLVARDVHNEDFIRVSGDAVCEKCGLSFFDHPNVHPDCPSMALTCDGTFVKL